MGKDDLKLLSMWASPFCMRVKVALAEKQIPYEEILENDLMGGKSELLLKSNPVHKQVPVLLHGEKPVVESANIIAYLDEVFPAKPLLPECAYERSRARFWADYINRKVSLFIVGINKTYIITHNPGYYKILETLPVTQMFIKTEISNMHI